MARKDLLTRLADAGEEAISKLGDTPGADRVLGVANTMRDRMDELQKKVRGLDELERRVADLERRLEQAEGGPSGRARRSTGARKSTTKKTTAASAAKKKSKGSGAAKARSSSRAATRTTRSGSRAEPTGPATQGASQAGNPGA